MLNTEDFLAQLPTSKEDWRYAQLPDYAQDYLNTSYLQIDEISDEEQKIINFFKKISLPVKKLHEESMRTVSIITSFCAKLYGKRNGKEKAKELKEIIA